MHGPEDKQTPTNVEAYIQAAPKAGRDKLQEMRAILNSVAPRAEEVLKWGKPVFVAKTILFAYSAHASHLSFIPTGPALQPFLSELSDYIVKKDSVQFPYHQALPADLIRQIAEYRKLEVEERNAKWRY